MGDTQFTYNDFLKYKTVSRETFLRLQTYVELLVKWQKTINLISNTTLQTIWQRHIIDSYQLIDYISRDANVIDIGSGAGLPGIIMAIAGTKNITLIESDLRKVAFLREAARVTHIDITIINQRVEMFSLPNEVTVTARAFATIRDTLLQLSKTLNASSKLLLLKGKNYKFEIEEAHREWNFDYEVSPSITDKEAVILSVGNITKKSVLN